MKPIEVKAHLNSLDGKTGRAILLGPNYLFARPITNSYVFKVGCHLCTGIMNWFVGEYYVDDKYGIVDERNENYDIYKNISRRTTMATIKDLEKYIDYEFSSGCYTGEDYKSFQTKYINFLRSICKQNHWQLVNVGRNHYCFSAFIKSAENKCVYVSISDVRFFTNEWYNNILIRTAKNEQDYHGGFNHRTTLKELEMKAMELLEDFPF